MACTGIDALNPLCLLKEKVDDISNSVLDSIANGIADAFASLMKTLTTFWIRIETPDINDGTAQFLQDASFYLTAAMAVASILVGAGLTAINQQGKPLKDLARSMITLMMIQSGGIMGVSALVYALDGIAIWIIDISAGRDFGRGMYILFEPFFDLKIGGSFLVIFVAFFGVIVSFLQVVAMLFRSALLVILVGVWPLSAAMTNTETGRNWFKRITAWILSFATYKLAAAFIYAGSFFLIGKYGERDDQELISAIMGLMLLGAAIIALPALMKLFTVSVSAISSGGAAMGGALAGAVMATGAITVSGGTAALAGGTGKALASGSKTAASSGASAANSAGTNTASTTGKTASGSGASMGGEKQNNPTTSSNGGSGKASGANSNGNLAENASKAKNSSGSEPTGAVSNSTNSTKNNPTSSPSSASGSGLNYDDAFSSPEASGASGGGEGSDYDDAFSNPKVGNTGSNASGSGLASSSESTQSFNSTPKTAGANGAKQSSQSPVQYFAQQAVKGAAVSKENEENNNE